MAKAALEALSLLMYLWFLQFEEKSIRIVKTWKMLLQAIDAKILATFTTKFLNENICHFVNLQCSFSYNFNSLMHLWDRVSYF